MPGDLRERLLASYANMGEAMVAQSVLEAGGVPCRIGDLAHVPSHMFGIAGAMGRSVGLWVLEPNVERATSLLSGLEPVDEETLAAEAVGAGARRSEAPAEQANAPAHGDASSATASDWLSRAGFALGVILVAALVERGCR